ncbi:MAG: peptidylprolyl isomerase [Candidatus Omnitrophica bacterium]|nr:peptidylprolyl isomerase [Candidatus Omnitrophota bacterium]
MLKLLRQKKVAKRIFYALAAIIIPAFVIWGSASVIDKNRTPNVAGEIFGRKISYDDFRRAVTAWKTQIRLQYGEEGIKAIGSLLDPVEGAWDRLILLYEAKKRRIRIDDRDVVAALARFSFLEKDGKFDPQAYGLFLQYTLGLSARQFEEQLRQNLAMAKIYDEVTKNVAVTSDEAREEYKKQHTQTRLRYVLFSPQNYKEGVKLTDEEVRKYFEASRENFKIPPQINVAYSVISYGEETTPEERMKAAEKMQTMARKAKTQGFKEASQAAGLEVKETGLFGLDDPVPTLGWMPQIKTVLFDTPQGSLTQPLETERGIYVFRILEKKDAYVPEFKEARDRAALVLTEEKASETAFQAARDFLSRVGKAGDKPEEQEPKKQNQAVSFDKAAQAMNATPKETPPFSRTSYIPELGLATVLKDAAFSLKKDEIYDKPVAVPQGFLVIQALETPSLDETKMSAEINGFQKTLLEQKRTEAFNAFFEELKIKARLKNNIAQMPAREAALPIEETN